MCGINGILRIDTEAPPVDREELLRTRDAMTSRGPDGSGLWISPREDVGFGHRRLAIIDLSEAGAQPMTSADGRYVIVFNGEIYNYRELRSELQREGVLFRSQSDTEVLLVLYSRLGTRMLPRLRGMYAFGIWDDLEKRLFLARDPYGIKPLYYSAHKGVFRFASQVRALEGAGTIPDTIDPGGLVGFLLWGSVPEPFTLRKNIRSLPAGHWMEVVDGRAGNTSSYFDFGMHPPHQATDPVEAIEDSVRAHLVSDVPVGVFLSAGVDSALLAVLARRHLSEPPLTFTLTFDEFRGSALDEGPGAEDVAELTSARHVERCVKREVIDRLWPAALTAMDQPTIDGFNVYLISNFAREAGLKVVLSGLGGDELFGSYPSFRDVPRWRRWASWGARVPGMATAWSGVSRAVQSARPKLSGLIRYGAHLSGSYFLRRGLFLPEEIAGLVGQRQAADGLAAYDPVADVERSLVRNGHGALDEWNSVHVMESSLYLRNQLLRDADWASMAHSLELRVPFVDVPLHQAMSAAGFEPARSHGKGAIARRAAPELHEATLSRVKSGFMVPAWKIPLRARKAIRWAHQARSLSLEVLDHFGISTEGPR